MKVPDDICGQIVRTVIDGAIATLDTSVTLVHLRALQEVSRGHFSGEMIGVTEVAKNLDIPMSTASRLLAQLGDFEPGIPSTKTSSPMVYPVRMVAMRLRRKTAST